MRSPSAPICRSGACGPSATQRPSQGASVGVRVSVTTVVPLVADSARGSAGSEGGAIGDESETSSFLDIFDVVTRYPNDVSRTYPEEGIVEQAGNEIVNGIYKRDGYHEGAIKFSKTGRYNGEPAAFSLYKCRVSNNTKHWYISLVPPDCVPGTSYDTDFYCAPEATDRHDLPPLGGWAKSNEGVDPLPYVRFRNWSSF